MCVIKKTIRIGNHRIGLEEPTYVVAEMSANHNHNINQAIKIIEAAKISGADAIKIQTYTADTITIDCDNDYFRIKEGPWKGMNLYQLYKEAYTPWEWQPELKKRANDLGMDLFSTPFDVTAVNFLENMDVPVYKVASFELVDIGLLRKIGQTGKPVIISTGMATLSEIDEAVRTIYDAGCRQVALLKCTSAYPAPFEDMNLRTIPHLAEAFGVPTGLSDHTLGIAVPIAAVALGACIIEKHFTLSRQDPGPDSAFSLEPKEFAEMVNAIRTVEKAKGNVSYGISERQKDSRIFRRSLFAVKDIKKDEPLTEDNVRSIRPGNGLHTRYLNDVIGRCASRDIKQGEPLSWSIVGRHCTG